MNIFLHEFRTYRKSTISWTITLVALSIIFMSMFPAMAENYASFNKIISSMPQAFLKAFGLSTTDLSTVLGYFSFVFTYVILLGSIQAMNLGTSILSSEIREKTADFLLVKPVKRSKIVTNKLLVVLTNIIITDIVFGIAAKILLDFHKQADYKMKTFILIVLSLFLVQLFFIGLGMFVSVIFRRLKSVLPVSLGIVFGFYIIKMLNETLEDEKLSYFSPLSYFETSEIIEIGKYNSTYLTLCIAVTITLTLLSYVIYNKKDIHAI